LRKIEFSDIIQYDDYIKIREKYLKKIIEIRKNRRIQVGEYITFVFENRETVLYQIQEMIRLEKMRDEVLIKNEIEIFNRLVPDKNELCATMFIEIFERGFIKSLHYKFAGIHENRIFLKFGDESITPEFEPEVLSNQRVSAVNYLKFKFINEQVKKFLDRNVPTFIEINHNDYQAIAKLPQNVRESLIKDLTV